MVGSHQSAVTDRRTGGLTRHDALARQPAHRHGGRLRGAAATSLGVLVPVLKDAGEIASPFGQLITAAATIADFGAIILLSVLCFPLAGLVLLRRPDVAPLHRSTGRREDRLVEST
jgi:hypothetical protein